MESNFIVLKSKRSINNPVDFCHFTQPFSHKKTFGVHPHMSKCWRGTWAKKGREPLP